MPQRYKDLTPEHRAKIDAIRAKRATPEARAEEGRLCELVEKEYPPAKAAPELIYQLARLKLERKRRGLSLANVAERSKIDRGMLSKLENGKLANPTFETLRRYARAIEMELLFAPIRGTAARQTKPKPYGRRSAYSGVRRAGSTKQPVAPNSGEPQPVRR